MKKRPVSWIGREGSIRWSARSQNLLLLIFIIDIRQSQGRCS